MKLIWTVILLAVCSCGQNGTRVNLCNQHFSEDPQINNAAISLCRAGRWPAKEPDVSNDPYEVVARERDPGYGNYEFYKPAFDQAMRSWWINGTMKDGSDLLIATNRNAHLDPSVVGYNVSQIVNYHAVSGTYSGPECNSGNGWLCYKVVEFVDSRTVRLNKKSKGAVASWNISILPPDYWNMCHCSGDAVQNEEKRKRRN